MVKIVGTNRKVLPQGIHTGTGNIKAPSLMVKKFRLSFFKSRSKVKVKVMRSKFLVQTERWCHKEHTCNMKALSLSVQK